MRRESLLFKNRAEEGEMFGCDTEPRLEEALTDPIIRSVMNADHVDPHALEVSLRATARRIGPAPRANEEKARIPCGA
jgi:hypothetical protein